MGSDPIATIANSDVAIGSDPIGLMVAIGSDPIKHNGNGRPLNNYRQASIIDRLYIVDHGLY